MAARDLEITILRRGKREDVLDLNADPDNIPGMQAVLKGWLEGNRWHAGRWGEFSAEIRYAGESKVRARVRA